MSENHKRSLMDIYEQIRRVSETSPDKISETIEQILQEEIIALADGDEEKLKKLQQLQWTISGELRKYKDPVARMNKMVELFWAGVDKFTKTLKSI